MVRTGATPSPETDGEPRKTLRPREEIGRGGGAAPVRPPGTQAQEARTTGDPASAPWWKRTGGWTGRGLRAWAGGAAPGGLDGKGAGRLGLGEEDQARGGGDRRTCRAPQGDSGGSHGPSVGLKAPRRVKMPRAVRPGLLPSKRRSDQLGDRGTRRSPCSAGLRLLMAQFLSFRTRNRGRKRGKEAIGERRGAKGRCVLELARTPRPGPARTHLPTQGQAPGVPEDRGLSRGAAFPDARGRGGQHRPGEDWPGGQWGPAGSRHRG